MVENGEDAGGIFIYLSVWGRGWGWKWGLARGEVGQNSSHSNFSMCAHLGKKTDHGHSAKSAGAKIHQNTHTHLTQRSRSGLTMLSRHSVGTYQGNKLTRTSSGKCQPQLSQLAEPLWTDPGAKNGISVRELISTLPSAYGE